MSHRVASSRRATKQARRKGAKSSRATTSARKPPPKEVELQKQLADALERQTASSEVLSGSSVRLRENWRQFFRPY
jgi:hypothetical protein